MERLTQTSNLGGVAFTFDLDITCKPSEAQKILKLAEKLKAYEDAEDQGLLLRLPCKVGDTVCLIKNDGTISERVADMMFIGVLWEEFGKTIFLTEEEAEAKLAEMEGAE